MPRSTLRLPCRRTEPHITAKGVATVNATNDECEHDWQVVNHDENREVLKCTKCGELKRE
jgi:hypothetical protein